MIKKIIYFLGLLPLISSAQEGGGQSIGGGGGGVSVKLPNPLGAGSIAELLDRIITGLIYLATPIAVIMILVGAYQILTAAGNPEKFNSGKKTILYVAIGYAIIISAKGISLLIKNILGI